MGLFNNQVVIRPTSTITVKAAQEWTQNWLDNNYQDIASNKDTNGNYINFYMADIFDGRSGNLYKVFSKACAKEYDMTQLTFTLLDTKQFASTQDVQTTATIANNNEAAIKSLIAKDGTTQAVVI